MGGFYEDACKAELGRLGYQKLLLTDSCTRALEIAAHLLELRPHDEVIVPSYGYVSTADVFAKLGAQLRFADSLEEHPNVDPDSIESLISSKTRAVVVIHYGGLRCDMKRIKSLCDLHELVLIEDNAHGIGNTEGLGAESSIGDYSALSFHSTKNIHCFSGGALQVHESANWEKAISYLNKGTDKAAFLAGEVPYYQWTSHGNASALSSLNAGFLKSQLGFLAETTQLRLNIWNRYQQAFKGFRFNRIANYTAQVDRMHNAHIYPVLLDGQAHREQWQSQLKEKGIEAYPHYNSLHRSVKGVQYGLQKCESSDVFSQGLLRLPLYPNLSEDEVDYIVENVLDLASKRD